MSSGVGEGPRVCAHGGGVQSTAMLVLSAQGKIDFPVHLFCNVGDDSENPDTLAYVREVSQPWAAERGVELIELHRQRRDGPETFTDTQPRELSNVERPTLAEAGENDERN